jgi:hypothetical protein
MAEKVFAVYLGGRAPKCNTELHDVVFVVGESIESTYAQLLDQWFGMPTGLHIDSWIELDIVDGHKISISNNKPDNAEKLYFINLGAYAGGQFTEIHANRFVVAESAQEAKSIGKSTLLGNWGSPVHTDDLYEVDDCLELNSIGPFFIALEKTEEKSELTPMNGYHIIPKAIVEEYIKRNTRDVA